MVLFITTEACVSVFINWASTTQFYPELSLKCLVLLIIFHQILLSVTEFLQLQDIVVYGNWQPNIEVCGGFLWIETELSSLLRSTLQNKEWEEHCLWVIISFHFHEEIRVQIIVILGNFICGLFGEWYLVNLTKLAVCQTSYQITASCHENKQDSARLCLV